MKIWKFRKRRDGAPEPLNLADSLGVSPRLASILWRRDLNDADDMGLFLSPMLRHLARPAAWPGVSAAADLLVQGLLAGKRLAVWGDYDVDGVTATALVMQVLRHHGFPVEWHLPDRQAEGSGLNVEHVEQLSAAGVDMLLTVDCGISDTAAVARARELGMRVVVSDHHLPPETLPEADVLCNPRLEDCPCASLAGVGVAFFIMAVWALGEALLDVRCLLEGKRVPVFKNGTDWKLDLAGLLEMGRSGSLTDGEGGNGSGTDYKGYLRILIFGGYDTDLVYRMMDVMQIVTAEKQPGFTLANCVCTVDAEALVSGKHVFFSNGLWKSRGREGGYAYDTRMAVAGSYLKDYKSP